MEHQSKTEIPHIDQSGASAVEYALLIAGIAAVLVVAIFALGRVTNGLFQDTCEAVTAPPAVTASC